MLGDTEKRPLPGTRDHYVTRDGRVFCGPFELRQHRAKEGSAPFVHLSRPKMLKGRRAVHPRSCLVRRAVASAFGVWPAPKYESRKRIPDEPEPLVEWRAMQLTSVDGSDEAGALVWCPPGDARKISQAVRLGTLAHDGDRKLVPVEVSEGTIDQIVPVMMREPGGLEGAWAEIRRRVRRVVKP